MCDDWEAGLRQSEAARSPPAAAAPALAPPAAPSSTPSGAAKAAAPLSEVEPPGPSAAPSPAGPGRLNGIVPAAGAPSGHAGAPQQAPTQQRAVGSGDVSGSRAAGGLEQQTAAKTGDAPVLDRGGVLPKRASEPVRACGPRV